ncbi:MAG: pentapeptide repeat-containing protein [Cyanobacteria bacterium]|nr:pentapeptide repeat-containing protein [Cyanobacteriota bacterium]
MTEPASFEKLEQQIEAVLEAETTDFFELAEIVGLDPKQDFVSADLSGVDLSGKDLSYANFTGANLQGANLSHANLEGTDFTGANFKFTTID